MNTRNLTYIVSTSNRWGSIIHITYHEANNASESQRSMVSAEQLSNYLNAMPEADFDGDLDYWWARMPAINRNIFIAMFMEMQMANEEMNHRHSAMAIGYEDHYDQRNWSSYSERVESSR